ncbi:MAG: xylan esterase [Vicinamibacteria bacterium]|nr:xylan esterase [Vicinamibacteria bacterium]
MTGVGHIAAVASIASVSFLLPAMPADVDDLVPANDPRIAVMGRVDAGAANRLRIGYPGVKLRVRFEGPSLAMRVASSTQNSHVGVSVDGGAPRVLRLPQEETDVILVEGLGAGRHAVDVVHRTETWQGIVTVAGFRLPSGGRLLDPLPWPRRRMLFIGDSVTCGEGVDRTPDCKKDKFESSNADLSYGMLLARRFDAQCHLVSYGGRGLIRDWQGRRDVLNAPQFFDMALPDESTKPPWDHAAYAPDVVVVSLGTNDFNLALGDFPDREEWVGAYVLFARAIRARYPEAHVFLTEGAIVNDSVASGRTQKTVLRGYIAETASRLADPRMHVFESRHYPGDACDAHPTGAQHAAMAGDIEPIIRAAVGW